MSDNNTVPTPTPADLARDLAADLAVVEAAPPGPWHHDPQFLWATVTTQPRGHGAIVARGHTALVECRRYEERGTAAAIAVMREAWPAAIRRTIAAEAECERLRFGIAEAADRLLAWCDMPDADATMRAVSRYLRQLLKEGNTNG